MPKFYERGQSGMLIIKDLDTKESWTFVRVKEGYAEAYAKIRSIINAGHRVGGDVHDVEYVMGPI